MGSSEEVKAVWWLMVAYLCPVCVLSSLFNVVLMGYYRLERGVCREHNVLLFNMAFADLVKSLLTVPLFLALMLHPQAEYIGGFSCSLIIVINVTASDVFVVVSFVYTIDCLRHVFLGFDKNRYKINLVKFYTRGLVIIIWTACAFINIMSTNKGESKVGFCVRGFYDSLQGHLVLQVIYIVFSIAAIAICIRYYRKTTGRWDFFFKFPDIKFCMTRRKFSSETDFRKKVEAPPAVGSINVPLVTPLQNHRHKLVTIEEDDENDGEEEEDEEEEEGSTPEVKLPLDFESAKSFSSRSGLGIKWRNFRQAIKEASVNSLDLRACEDEFNTEMATPEGRCRIDDIPHKKMSKEVLNEKLSSLERNLEEERSSTLSKFNRPRKIYPDELSTSNGARSGVFDDTSLTIKTKDLTPTSSQLHLEDSGSIKLETTIHSFGSTQRVSQQTYTALTETPILLPLTKRKETFAVGEDKSRGSFALDASDSVSSLNTSQVSGFSESSVSSYDDSLYDSLESMEHDDATARPDHTGITSLHRRLLRTNDDQPDRQELLEESQARMKSMRRKRRRRKLQFQQLSMERSSDSIKQKLGFQDSLLSHEYGLLDQDFPSSHKSSSLSSLDSILEGEVTDYYITKKKRNFQTAGRFFMQSSRMSRKGQILFRFLFQLVLVYILLTLPLILYRLATLYSTSDEHVTTRHVFKDSTYAVLQFMFWSRPLFSAFISWNALSLLSIHPMQRLSNSKFFTSRRKRPLSRKIRW